MQNRRILLGVTGGIAAYKAAELTRLLIKAGAEVRVVMTPGAREFVAPLTFQALSGNPVHTDLLDADAEAAMGHIELARWADDVLVAPASADFIARLNSGLADDLLATACLATSAQIWLAPAMNSVMWANPATQDNCAALATRGVNLLGPGEGEQACLEVGPGRMLEPAELVAAISRREGALSGKSVLITAGPTYEDLDPVRFLGNRSSGKMGFALATAAVAAGANVTVVCGPVSLDTPTGVSRIDVRSAREMHEAVHARLEGTQLFVGAAAVADFTPKSVSERKIKKASADSTLTLELTQNPDILKSVADAGGAVYVVGFAAETQDVETNARKKLSRKGADMIIANRVGGGCAFDQDDNEAVALWGDGEQRFAKQSKRDLARNLVALIAEHMVSTDAVRPTDATDRSQTA